MAHNPWKNEMWFTSPWNYLEEATKELHFNDTIKIHDITLRDGEQQAGIVFSREDKVEIAKELSSVGVHRIEAGMPAVSPQDEAAIKEIVDLGLNSEIFCLSRCMVADVELAKKCGVKGITIEIPSSEHIIKYAYGWELKKAIDLSIQATLAAKEAGLYTVFFPVDASRANLDWFLDLIEQISTAGHMDALGLVDTFGVCAPHCIPAIMSKIKSRISKPLEPHFHDDFNLGVANTIAALYCGGTVAHTTVSGIGERAGNTPMEDLVLALLTLYGKDIGIKTEKLFSLSKLVHERAQVTSRSNRSIIGDSLYNIESGIIATWMRMTGEEHLLEIIPYKPQLVGQNPVKLVMGKNSGIDSVRTWLESDGIQANESQMLLILKAVKQKSYDKKGLLTRSEFREIAETILK
jgi:isopropylmalate/homocitrate/citramalate synthase